MRKNVMKFMAGVAAATLCAGLLAGCSAKTEPSDTTKATENSQENTETTATETVEDKKDLEKITIALDWTPNTNHTGLYVANELGYFAQAGIQVEILEAVEEGAEALVASGSAQFGVSFQDYLVPLFATPEEERVPVTAVAAIISHNTSGIVASKESGITKPSEMAGHSYATWDLPIEQAILKQVITADGGDWDQVELVSQYVENIQGAFESGIDTVWIYYAWDGIKTELANLDANFFYFKDYDERLDEYSPVLIANNDFLANNSELAKKFMEAVSKGYQYAIENPEDAATILVNANEGMDYELVLASQKWLADQYQSDAAYWGQIDQTRWDNFFDWIYENELCEYEIPDGYGFTNEFLPQ